MKYLIVNGDDFGASLGINRAIAELHELGVLTSASLMMTMPAADNAVQLAKQAPRLGVGLHATLTTEEGVPLLDFDDAERCYEEIRRQVDAFYAQLGRLPTHIDAHQNVHRDARLTAVFQRIASRCRLPLREHSPARYLSKFYGQWDGDSHPEQIGIRSLIRILETELSEGVTELSCHPGYMGPDFTSSYDGEREVELRTLSDPRLRDFFARNSIELITFGDLQSVVNRAFAT